MEWHEVSINQKPSNLNEMWVLIEVVVMNLISNGRCHYNYASPFKGSYNK